MTKFDPATLSDVMRPHLMVAAVYAALIAVSLLFPACGSLCGLKDDGSASATNFWRNSDRHHGGGPL